MAIKPGMITCNTTDAVSLAHWWADQTGGDLIDESDGWFVFVVLPDGPRLGFQKVSDPTPGRNRIHVDFTSDDLDVAKQQLLGSGAGHVRDEDMGGFRWSTFTDPDGNEFCVSGPHAE